MLMFNDSQTKAVSIELTWGGNFQAYYMQEDESKSLSLGFGQILDSRMFANEKRAKMWACQKLQIGAQTA